ncbi:MAG: UvrD-helicase domain-containing protein [Gammaproteobacteria bacterium]|nr:UvrD-helicase domain-containing protein [Gammaproteobacteria bacterium]
MGLTKSTRPADQSERDQALDPAHSFIVQAPAGSGKTELLAQRVLVLLAGVKQPEEVVAITFTRKAAAEMRGRILEALQKGKNDQAPTAEHQRRSWTLARAVIARDTELGWHIESNPGRLRVQTIDALCASLTRQMPLLSGLGAQPRITEKAEQLYLEAALRTLAELEAKESWSADIERLLEHLDNDLNRLAELLASMLQRRDQWIRHVVGQPDRKQLEQAFVHSIENALKTVTDAIPYSIQAEITDLARLAAEHLQAVDKRSALLGCLNHRHPAGNTTDQLPFWLGVCELLLNKKGDWRKRFSKAEGFPAPSATKDKDQKAKRQAMKNQAATLVGRLGEIEGLQTALGKLRRLPPTCYSEGQWQTLEALLSLLLNVLAQLRLVFQEHGEVDFTAISQAALQALGEEQQPTDLALALDYRIQHLLIDEFQDTSLSQYQLLERLTSGWQPGDGRTLFCVGDPMQSIYRFREAEVGLYLRARRYGIGELELIPLTLSVNFRSTKDIVEWINDCFSQILPKQEDIAGGAVSYAPAQAIHPGKTDEAVQFHAALGDDRVIEARQVVYLVQQARRQRPAAPCAILVRSRSHLAEIVPLLRAQGLRFRAVEIESMSGRQVVLDLLALTLALNHPADRIAWLSILRAPWCALTLDDLHALSTQWPDNTIPQLLSKRSCRHSLSNDGQTRLTRVADILLQSLGQRRRHSLHRWVESTWLALGGPAVVPQARDLEAAQVFLSLLDALDQGGTLTDRETLQEQVQTLYAPTDPEADESLQLMTIHKAKGLEFDTVIIPGLGRRPKTDEQRLLVWLEWPRTQGDSDLLLSPIKGATEQQSRAYGYIVDIEKEKARYEDGRLLYVAATRARNHLHLLGHVSAQDREGTLVLGKPVQGSLLNQMWPVVEQEFHRQATKGCVETPPQDTLEDRRNVLQRLPAYWCCPAPPPGVRLPGNLIPEANREQPLEYEWAAPLARIIGMVVHSLLQLLPGWSIDNDKTQKQLRHFARNALIQHGLQGTALKQALRQVEQTLDKLLVDPRGRWIIDPTHRDAHNEYPLSGYLDGRIVNLVIDRCFIDAQDIRWIIDYKSGSHQGGGQNTFLDQEQARYKPQLDKYGRLFAMQESRTIRLGLYYPLLQGWREWGLGE